jgi:hypothetical protein
MNIKMREYVGEFAENKDVARKLRLEHILPTLEKNEDVTLDFEGVSGATQSFIHALISDVIRKKGSDVLDNMLFKNCAENVKKMIGIVVDYMQES